MQSRSQAGSSCHHGQFIVSAECVVWVVFHSTSKLLFTSLQSAFNILSPSVSTSGPSSASYGDIVAHTLAWLFSLLPFSAAGNESGKLHIDIPSLSKQIS